MEQDDDTSLNYKEANEFLEDVQHFLVAKGHVKDALTLGSVVDTFHIYM